MTEYLNDVELQKINTDILGSEDKDSIFISKNALEQVTKIKTENNVPEEYLLRLGTRSGGCSGMNYIIGFDSEINDYDKVIPLKEVNLVVDRSSLFYLMGITLDFVNDVNGSGFVFNNPNNIKTCGCGSGGGH